MNSAFTESVVEDAALAWVGSFSYPVKHGPEIAPGELQVKRHNNMPMEAFNG